MEGIRWAFNFKHWSPKRDEWMLCLSLIQKEERDRISKFVFKKDAKASLAGRLLIRKLVAETLKISWSNVMLRRTKKGRPYHVIDNLNNLNESVQLDFNVSHQGEWVVLAAETFGPKIGVDVVKIENPANKNTPEFFRLMNRQFSSNEWSIIKAKTTEQAQLKAFYRNWCLKEAFVKSLGVGITYDLQSISFIPSQELVLESIIEDTKVKVNGTLENNWCFEESLIDENHIAIVAFQLDHILRGYKKAPSPFRVLSYEEIIANSEQLFPCDENLGNAFMLKEESPGKY